MSENVKVKLTKVRDVRAYRIAAAAKLLKVDRSTVKNWLDDGTLKEVTTTCGQRMCDATSVERMIARK